MPTSKKPEFIINFIVGIKKHLMLPSGVLGNTEEYLTIQLLV